MSSFQGLQLDAVPLRTAEMFRVFAEKPQLKDFILIGGTALSLQIGHRLSEDLDFWWHGNNLRQSGLSAMLNEMRNAGANIFLATSPKDISKAKINGYNLLEMIQEYVIDGVKVSFCARQDVAYNHFSTMSMLQVPEVSFKIAAADTVFNIKSWLINTRARSRDLFDLKYYILNHDKTLKNLLDAGVSADHEYSIESAKNVLTGVDPLDTEDEGFESIGVEDSIEDIYRFFTDLVNEYEKEIAAEILKKNFSGSKLR